MRATRGSAGVAGNSIFSAAVVPRRCLDATREARMQRSDSPGHGGFQTETTRMIVLGRSEILQPLDISVPPATPR